MPELSAGHGIREILLDEIWNQQPKNDRDQGLQQNLILRAAKQKLPAHPDEAILTQWSELFRSGLLAWGADLLNPGPPHFHMTDRGRRALEQVTRDPSNPAGYVRHLKAVASISPTAESYVNEALECYVAGLFKASAVMVGCAAESIVLSLRDAAADAFRRTGKPCPKGLEDWKIRTVTTTLHKFFEGEKSSFGQGFQEAFEAYWPAFSQQIRAMRNEAGHPSSIEPVTPDTVHASLLVFPELARLANKRSVWVTGSFV